MSVFWGMILLYIVRRSSYEHNIIQNGYQDTAVCMHNCKNSANGNKEREITWVITNFNFNLMLNASFLQTIDKFFIVHNKC